MRVLALSIFILGGCAKPAPIECPNARFKLLEPITFFMSSGISEEQELIFKEAANVWNDYIGEELVKTSRYKGTSKLTFIYDEWSRQSNALAVAKIVLTTTNYDVDIIVNYPIAKDVDFKSLMVHEIGHAIGLGHPTDPTSVMAPTLSINQINTNLSLTDREAVDCLY